MSYVQGTIVRVSAVFTDVKTKLPIEPTEVLLRIDVPGQNPMLERKLSDGGVINDPDVAGGYYADIDTTNGPAGTWHYQFESSGSAKVVERRSLTIRSRF